VIHGRVEEQLALDDMHFGNATVVMIEPMDGDRSSTASKQKCAIDFGDMRTVFLDRDGVLNEKMPEGSYVLNWAQFRLLPGVMEAIGRLNRANRRVIVVSNQRGIALRLYSSVDVEAIHASLQDVLRSHGAHVDSFYFCPHDTNECNCRKPLPGLFELARADFPDIQPATSVMIGDSLSDIEFGRALGMRCIFIEGDPTQPRSDADCARSRADLISGSLWDAVDQLLGAPKPVQ
jgi:D-glycero-D-manno-heptose 1,7-bisphosphate phosphatase